MGVTTTKMVKGTIIKLSEEYMRNMLDKILKIYSIEDILYGKFNKKDLKEFNIGSLIAKFGGIQNLFIRYFSIKGILYNGKIIDIDSFKNKPNGYYTKEKIIKLVKNYCEIECRESILLVKHETKLLKNWCKKYWNAKYIDNISTIILNKKYTLYNLLILCYPEIYKEHILFAWELNKCYSKSDSKRNKYLKEFIKYRMNIKNYNDIIQVLNSNILKKSEYTYFSTTLLKYYKTYNFYQWANKVFPQYSSFWSEKDFGKIYVGKDGSRLNSSYEKRIFDFVYDNLNIKEIKAVGIKRNKKYVYYDAKYDSNYYPNFIINFKNNLPIVIEYYGMLNHQNKSIVTIYKEKMYRKNKYYKERNDIYFIDLYPDDLKNKFEGVKRKINNIMDKVT